MRITLIACDFWWKTDDEFMMQLERWWFSAGMYKYKPGYKSHDLIWIECSHWLKLQHLDWRENLVNNFFFQINFPPIRALEFIIGHVNYNLAYTYKFQLKTTVYTLWQKLSHLTLVIFKLQCQNL